MRCVSIPQRYTGLPQQCWTIGGSVAFRCEMCIPGGGIKLVIRALQPALCLQLMGNHKVFSSGYDAFMLQMNLSGPHLKVQRLAAGDSGKMLTGAHFYEPLVSSLSWNNQLVRKAGFTAGARGESQTHLELCLWGKRGSGPGEVWVCAELFAMPKAHRPGRSPDFLAKPKSEPTGPIVPLILVSIKGTFPAGLNCSGSLWVGEDCASRSSWESSASSGASVTVPRGQLARPFGSYLWEKRSFWAEGSPLPAGAHHPDLHEVMQLGRERP